jgi:hypothetical protein
MDKNDWLKWHYENNGPYAVIKTGFSHALYMSVAMLFFSIFVGIGSHLGDYEKIFYFSLITFFTTSIFFLFITIPLILIHAVHYKIFKKILLENKLEKSILICLFLVFIHFLIVYSSIDFITLNLKVILPPIEFTFLVFSYILGLIKGFTIFHGEFYKTLNPQKQDSEIWRSHITKEENYF